MDTNILIPELHQILTTTIANHRFFYARMLGFRSEAELADYLCEKEQDILAGGQFLFGKRSGPQHELIYVTVTPDEPDRYIAFYDIISSLPVVKELYLLSYSPSEEWGSSKFKIKTNAGTREDIDIPEPDFNFYKYSTSSFSHCEKETMLANFRRKNNTICCRQKENRLGYLSDYSQAMIESIYANRFFLDVLLRDHRKGMIDFDVILRRDDQFTIMEAKEKDPGGEENHAYFGWDSRRLAWYLYLQNCIELETLYVIRQINNQNQRQFVNWKYITLNDFAASASWLSETGGGGGSGTITAPLRAFKDLDCLFE